MSQILIYKRIENAQFKFRKILDVSLFERDELDDPVTPEEFDKEQNKEKLKMFRILQNRGLAGNEEDQR